jgi:hypothetical protein
VKLQSLPNGRLSTGSLHGKRYHPCGEESGPIEGVHLVDVLPLPATGYAQGTRRCVALRVQDTIKSDALLAHKIGGEKQMAPSPISHWPSASYRCRSSSCIVLVPLAE